VVLVRACRREEIATVLDLWRDAGAPPSVTDDAAGLNRLLDRDPQCLLVAEVDGEVGGTLIAGFDGWRGHMYRLAVLPVHRRRGIARRLVAEGEQRLRRLGAVRIGAVVITADPQAVGFWSMAGYRLDGTMGRFVKEL
jgi:ribosomal protein S18 acetylase RimI-like enzyme